MPSIQDKWASKGEREPTAGLIQQGQYSRGLWAECQNDLAQNGFQPDWGQRMAKLITSLVSATGSQQDTWNLAHDKTRQVAQATQQAKDFISRLVAVVPVALRTTPVPEVCEEQFHGAAKLKRTTPKILGYLAETRPAVARAEAALKPFFQGESPVARLDLVRSALEQADQIQENALASAPDATLALNAQKGELLQLIEDLNRIGRVAFHGQAEIAARFNKDILLRARRSKTGKAEPAPAPGPAKPA
jgi:hypothetical protein